MEEGRNETDGSFTRYAHDEVSRCFWSLRGRGLEPVGGGGHYFHTPKAGGKVDKTRLTQVGRALARLGIEHIAAYSPEARGRSERAFRILQDRLPKERALAAQAPLREGQGPRPPLPGRQPGHLPRPPPPRPLPGRWNPDRTKQHEEGRVMPPFEAPRPSILGQRAALATTPRSPPPPPRS